MLGEGEWVDGGPLLAAACDGMAVGELLHSPSFSLFDATTAIEIGDPKMDIGLNRGAELGSPEELIEGGAAPLALPPPRLLALMDRLLVLEASWHTGSMLPQTVFTSLYMLRPQRLAPNAPLHAYCLALRSICSACVELAHGGSVTEDEDFLVHTFGIAMLDPPGEAPIKAALQALAAAEEELEQWVAVGGGGGGSRGGGSGGGGKGKGTPPAGQAQQQAAQEPQQEAAQQQPDEAQAAALLARVRFRRLLLEALQSLKQYSQAGVEAARKQCQLAEAQLQLVADSAGLAAPHEEAPGFEPEVNRRHMGLVPPRPVKPLSFDAAVEHWRSLLRGLAGGLHSLLFVRGSWPALRSALVSFAAQDHHSIVRSVLHLQLFKPLPPAPAAEGTPDARASKLLGGGGNGGRGRGPGGGGGKKAAAAELPPWCPGQQMVCSEFGLSLTSVPSPEAAMFVEQAAIAIQGQAYALCLNRCRQRRRLRRLMEDWRNIFDHGFNADVTEPMQQWLAKAGWRWPGAQEGMLQGQGPAATWAEREGAACALLHFQLGFPLDLYAPHEYLQLYWYGDYLLDVQQRLTSLLHAAAPPAPPRRGAGATAGGKPRGGRGGSLSAAQRGAGEDVALARNLEVLLLDVDRQMHQGMFRAAISLQQLGCVAPPDAPFNSEEQRYEQRFACLDLLARPELLPYEHYRAQTDASGLEPARVLAAAAANFAAAGERAASLLGGPPPVRALLRDEQVRHLEGAQRTATQNGVACKLLAATSASVAAAAASAGGGGEEGQQRKGPPAFRVSFDFKTALAASVAHFYPALVLKH